MPTVAERAPVVRRVEVWLPMASLGGLGSRALRLCLAAAATAALWGALAPAGALPELALCLCLVLGAVAAGGGVTAVQGGLLALILALLLGAGEANTSLPALLLGQPGAPAALLGRQLWAIGGVLGAATALGLGGRGADWREQAVFGALAGGTGLGLAVALGAASVQTALPPAWTAGLRGGLVALGFAAVLPVAALRRRVLHRLPDPRVLERKLRVELRPPVEQAAVLDAAIARSSVDGEAREGLAEVAVWVLRLQWLRQELRRELEESSGPELSARVERFDAEAAAADDSFLAERKSASAGHLRRLIEHREEIAAEDRRTEAMVEYALAFLEEARAGLALSRVQPEDQVPGRLADVLTRLRSHQHDQRAQRAAARELLSVGVG